MYRCLNDGLMYHMDTKRKGKNIDLNEKFVLEEDYFSRKNEPSGVDECDHLLEDDEYERKTLLSMTSENVEQANEFYNYYAKYKGFGSENVGFVAKDLYNKIDTKRRKIIAIGDAEYAIKYPYENQDSDKAAFYYKYDVNEKGRLHKFFGQILD
ncbi:hypothetical protein ACH5RR_030082 [Cinchona calisaya]|uniref:Uncharacterized protein n=1 Tax=Cinchona calisaya TaxID=153742 RepID=A0ABD2YTI9_9GENT